MPSPVAHTAAGYFVYRLLRRPEVGEPHLLLTTVVFALLPDADAAVGLMGEDFGRYHNNISHSLGFGLVTASLGAAIAWRKHGRFRRCFLAGLLAYCSHLVLDFWATRRGLLLFWPLSRRRYVSPARLFYGLRWGRGALSLTHLWTLVTELLFTLALLGLAPRLINRVKQ